MSLKYHHSLAVAQKVRAFLSKITPRDTAKNIWVESWANCREQGLCFVYRRANQPKYFKAVTAECRNSDSIVVVVGSDLEFNNQTNQPNEEIWQKNRQTFDSGDYKSAAIFILNYFQEQ